MTRTREWPFPQQFRFCGVPSYLLAVALENGIDRDYAIETIRRYRIAPPSDSPENWPWPVKIFTLGRFEGGVLFRPAATERPIKYFVLV